MSFASYWSAFRQVWREDRQFAYLGPRRLSLLAMHYRGRCEARFDLLPKVGTEYLKHFSRMIDLTFSAPYLGALEGVFLDVKYDFPVCSNDRRAVFWISEPISEWGRSPSHVSFPGLSLSV